MLLNGAPLNGVVLNGSSESSCFGTVSGFSKAAALVAATVICSGVVAGAAKSYGAADTIRGLGVGASGSAKAGGSSTASLKTDGAVQGTSRAQASVILGQNFRTVTVSGLARAYASVTGEPVNWQIRGVSRSSGSAVATLKAGAMVAGLASSTGLALPRVTMWLAVNFPTSAKANVSATLSAAGAAAGLAKASGAAQVSLNTSGATQGLAHTDGSILANLRASGAVLGPAITKASAAGSLRLAPAASGLAKMTGYTAAPTVWRGVAVAGAARTYASHTATLKFSCSVAGRSCYNGAVSGVVRHLFFNWTDGVAYRVVQDPSVNGLVSGGLSRNELTSNLQRIGL